METFYVKIWHNGNYANVDADPRMPFILADQIKKVVEDFYKD